MKRIRFVCLVFLYTASLLNAQDPHWDWVMPFYSPDEERATAVASDPGTGEVYLAGEWRGDLMVAFPDGVSESTDFTTTFGGIDGAVVKLDPGGNVRWAFKVGGDGDDRINDIHVDENGHIYICGALANGNASFAGTGTIDATTEFFNPGFEKAFLAKYDRDGLLVWVKFAGGIEFSDGRGIASNKEGVYLTGSHQGTISFGMLPPYTSVSGTDMFIIKYTPDGDEIWHVSAGSDQDDYGEDITCDETNVYVCGRFSGSVLDYKDLSGEMVISTINTADGQFDGFAAGFTTDGFHQWTRIIASGMDDDCRGLVMDSEHIYLAGTIGQEAIFPFYPANPVPYKGGKDAYVCALTRTDGATRWVRTLAGDADGNQVVNDLSMDLSGSLYMTGFYNTNVVTTDSVNDSKGLEDIFLASYTNSGDEKWIKTAGGSGIDMGNGVCAATPEIVYLAGEYMDITAFDSNILPGDGNQNMFAARLNLDCMDAVGGHLSAVDTVLAEGEVLTLMLKDYYGDIQWEFSLPGLNNWSPLSADISEVIQVFPSGTADYRAFVTSSACAPDYSNVIRVEVLNSTIRFADAGEDVTICPGDSLQLKASGGDFYKWDPHIGLDVPDVPDPWAKPRNTTDYVVHVTQADGLTDTDTITVFVLPRPKVVAGEDIQICQGEQAVLSAVADMSLVWHPSQGVDDPRSPNPTTLVDTTTTFTVVVTDTSGCRGHDEMTVFVTTPPVPEAGPDKTTSAVFEIQMEALLGPGESGTWNVESGNGIFENLYAPVTRVSSLEVGENIFTWTVTNGICPETVDRVKITVNDFLVPTVITPNGDGKNDYFNVSGIERFADSELVVLNRWGDEVYRVSPYHNAWDGVNQNGVELSEDTYYVILKITDDDIRKGFLMIIR